jgi:acyl-CoA dehydrogenase
MAWDFETEPAFQEKLDWMEEFVRDEIFPLETLREAWRSPEGREQFKRMVAPLKEEVKRQGLWAAHLPPDMGGLGFGQVKLGLMHEILGQTPYGPAIFGNQAPDSGNAELLAVGGTPEQKERWMQPLLDGEIRSCFSMTEPTAGADPTLLSTEAVRDGDEWVINGHKWFSSNASVADVLIVMARTGDPDTHAYQSFSMFIVPTDTPGVNILRDVPTMGEPDHRTGEPGGHAEILYEDVRVPFDSIVGGEAGIGQGFALAQKRLGPGRIHHAMRWLGQSRRAFDMLCERALTRYTHGSLLAEKQMIQDWIAESYAERQAARLLTLEAAWKMDQLHAAGKHYSDARRPGDPDPRQPRLHHRPPARGDVPRGPRGAHLRRSRRGPQGDGDTPAPQALQTVGAPDRARAHPACGGTREVCRPARPRRAQFLTAAYRARRVIVRTCRSVPLRRS